MGKTVVIGTIFVDIKGFSFADYDPAGRNLGDIKIVHGGVGRNVAENLANSNVPASFVGMLEESEICQGVERHLNETGVDISDTVRVPANGIGKWVVIIDEKGSMRGSISSMPDTGYLESYLKENGERIISGADNVIIEMDLNETIADLVVSLCLKHQKSVYAIVGNMSVILARRDLISKTDCFICNEIEASRFFNKEELKGYSPRGMLEFLPGAAGKAGIGSMVVTMGKHGAVYYDGRDSGICKPYPAKVIDTSGAGDAFFSGTVMGLMRNEPLSEAVKLGSRLAAVTISSEETTYPGEA